MASCAISADGKHLIAPWHKQEAEPQRAESFALTDYPRRLYFSRAYKPRRGSGTLFQYAIKLRQLRYNILDLLDNGFLSLGLGFARFSCLFGFAPLFCLGLCF